MDQCTKVFAYHLAWLLPGVKGLAAERLHGATSSFGNCRCHIPMPHPTQIFSVPVILHSCSRLALKSFYMETLLRTYSSCLQYPRYALKPSLYFAYCYSCKLRGVQNVPKDRAESPTARARVMPYSEWMQKPFRQESA